PPPFVLSATETTQIYPLSLHDALPILVDRLAPARYRHSSPCACPRNFHRTGSATHQFFPPDVGGATGRRTSSSRDKTHFRTLAIPVLSGGASDRSVSRVRDVRSGSRWFWPRNDGPVVRPVFSWCAMLPDRRTTCAGRRAARADPRAAQPRAPAGTEHCELPDRRDSR